MDLEFQQICHHSSSVQVGVRNYRLRNPILSVNPALQRSNVEFLSSAR